MYGKLSLRKYKTSNSQHTSYHSTNYQYTVHLWYNMMVTKQTLNDHIKMKHAKITINTLSILHNTVFYAGLIGENAPKFQHWQILALNCISSPPGQVNWSNFVIFLLRMEGFHCCRIICLQIVNMQMEVADPDRRFCCKKLLGLHPKWDNLVQNN